MEDIQLFLLIIGMIAFTIIKFIKKATEVTSHEPTEESEEEDPELFTMAEQIPIKKSIHESVSIKDSSSNPSRLINNRKRAANTTSSAENSTTTNNSSHTLIRLNSRSEAKRAFIYSELFNRKY